MASDSVGSRRSPSLLGLFAPNEATWDAFVQGHPHGHLLQLSPWAALKGAFGWQCHRVAVAAPAGLLAGAQMLVRRQYGFAAAYVPRGPLFSGLPDVDALLLDGLRRSLKGQRAIFLRIEPNLLEHDPAADDLHAALARQQWQPIPPLQPRSTVQLDLSLPTDALFAAFSKGHRADIRRAEREGVTVRVGSSPADLAAFYTLMHATTARKSDYAIHSADYYRRAFELFAAQGSVALLLAELHNVPVGTCMLFAGAHEGLYLYGGSNEVGLKKGANHLLQWHALQWAKAQGCLRYDFWGVPDAFGRAALATDPATRERLEAEAQDDPLYGVYRFKKGFGGTIVRFMPAYDQIYFPPLYALWKRRNRQE